MSSTMEEASALSVSGWAWLPNHLLDSILEKLIPISDHIRFSAVCKHWQSAFLHQKQRHHKPRHKQLPMLMIPSKHNINQRRGLYCVAQGKLYSFEFQVPNNLRCCGCSQGWLTCVDTVDKNLVIILLNPFTGWTIRLPPVEALWGRSDDSIHKVVFSADPSLFPNDYEALLVYGQSWTKLAHFRSGDDAWTTHLDNRIRFSNLIYHKGQFLAASFDDGGVFSVKISSSSNSITKLHVDVVVERVSGFGRPYLAESSAGDLLMISKLQITDHILYKVYVFFKVFKLQCVCEEDIPGFAEEIEGVGNDAFFLGDNESLCVSALDFPGCQSSSIYFSTDGWAPPPEGYTRGQFIKAAFKFNLGNQTLEELYYCDPPSQKNLPSIWILPTMV